jgi:hypothetical protein
MTLRARNAVALLLLAFLAPYGYAQMARYCENAVGTVDEKLMVLTPGNAECDPGGLCIGAQNAFAYQLKISGPDPFVYAIVPVSKETWDNASIGDSMPWLFGQIDECATPAAPATVEE